ncbi:MAG: VWA domain-containing protein [Acidobacteriales bacterium]|nr:VWA domain-containing protein [Terriglobales bacterium]
MKDRSTLITFAVAFLAVLAGLTLMAMPPGPPPPPQPKPALHQDPSPQTATPQTSQTDVPAGAQEQSDGALRSIAPDGTAGAFCPLKHTDVQAEISGFLARVTVTQEFVNPTGGRIEAIYTFPLPQNAAVDDMTLVVGERVVRGLIKKREEAQKIYQQARNAGQTAALLDQERPNIFTQSVANIPANSPVKVVISYIETLKYEAGSYEFVYPMVVGPRYIPGNAIGTQAGGWAQDTDRVPDASRITPSVAGVHVGKKGSRAGHDISLSVKLDAGVPIQELKSFTHDVDVQTYSARSAVVKLRSETEIPNRDFVLKYDVSGSRIEDALLTHAGELKVMREGKGGAVEDTIPSGYFTFLLQPPDRVREEDATPRELIFVLDTSGSMSGYPIETAKKVMRKAIQNMRAGDTFNLITFAGDTQILFPQPVEASSANIQKAVQFLDGRRGGGTEMMKAIRAALGEDAGACKLGQDCAESARAGAALRVVCFMTDGYVGNDMEIIGEVQKHSDARVFSFGIGSSVNRFLLDGMSKAGRGEVEYVLRQEDADPAAERFYERVHTPVLTDISVDFGNLPVADVMPAKPLDLFTAKPLVLTGRYTAAASGTITLRGKRAGKPFERAIKVDLPGQQTDNRALAQLWARRRIDDLMSLDWNGMQSGSPKPEVREQITQLGLDYRLMTQFTSFVAVEERSVVEGGQLRTIQVPVEMPQNVSPEGVFGVDGVSANSLTAAKSMRYSGFAPGIVSQSLNSVQTTSSVITSDAASERPGNAVGPIFKRKDQATRDAEKKERDAKARTQLEAKLHPALLAVFDCWKSNPRAKCAGLSGGNVKVHLWLTAATPQLQQELQTLGFVTSPDPSHRLGSKLELVGEIAVEKLSQLVSLSEVKLIGLEK